MTTLGASCDALLYFCTHVTLRRNKGVACSSTGTRLLSVRFGATASVVPSAPGRPGSPPGPRAATFCCWDLRIPEELWLTHHPLYGDCIFLLKFWRHLGGGATRVASARLIPSGDGNGDRAGLGWGLPAGCTVPLPHRRPADQGCHPALSPKASIMIAFTKLLGFMGHLQC